MSDYEKLKADFDAQARKMEDWKVKVKQMTLRDRAEIARQKEEVEQLNVQLSSMAVMLKEKDGIIKEVREKNDELSETAKDGELGVVRAKSLEQKIREMAETIAGHVENEKKSLAISENLKERVLELESLNHKLQAQIDGTPILTHPKLKVLKRTSHTSSKFCLCSTPEHSPRWFAEDHLVAIVGPTPLPSTDEEEAVKSYTEKHSEEISILRDTVKSLKTEAEHTVKQKEQEIEMLVRRIETLQTQHSQTLQKHQQNEAASRDKWRLEADSNTIKQYESQLSELQAELSHVTAKVKSATEDNTKLRVEFKQYKLHAQAALSRQTEDAAPTAPASSTSTDASFEARNTALQKEIDECKLTIRSLEALVNDKEERLKAMGEKLESAFENAEESNRLRYELAADAKKLKKQLEEQQLQRQQQKVTTPTKKEVTISESREGRYEAEVGTLRGEIKRLKSEKEGVEERLDACRQTLKSVTDELRAKEASSTPSEIEERVPTPVATVVQLPEDQYGASEDDQPLRSSDFAFDFDDVLGVAELGSHPNKEHEFTQRKLLRMTRELADTRRELESASARLKDLPQLQATIVDLQRSISRRDSARSLDYLKNTVLQFCLAKGNCDVQTALIPLLSDLLQLSAAEQVSLKGFYPP